MCLCLTPVQQGQLWKDNSMSKWDVLFFSQCSVSFGSMETVTWCMKQEEVQVLHWRYHECFKPLLREDVFLFFICCNLTGNMCSFSELFVWLRPPNPSISLYGIIAQRKTFSELLITILILSGVSWPHSLANPSQLLNWSTNYIRDLRLSHLLCEPVRACVQAKNVRPYGSEAWYALQDRKYHGLLLIWILA